MVVMSLGKDGERKSVETTTLCMIVRTNYGWANRSMFVHIYIFQERVGELAGCLKDRGYEESLVNEQIDRVGRLDRATLLANSGNRTNDQGRGKWLHLLRHFIQRSILWGRLPGDSILCSRIRRGTGHSIDFRCMMQNSKTRLRLMATCES